MDTLDYNPVLFEMFLQLDICKNQGERITKTLNIFDKCVYEKKNVKYCNAELNNLIYELHKCEYTKKVYLR